MKSHETLPQNEYASLEEATLLHNTLSELPGQLDAAGLVSEKPHFIQDYADGGAWKIDGGIGFLITADRSLSGNNDFEHVDGSISINEDGEVALGIGSRTVVVAGYNKEYSIFNYAQGVKFNKSGLVTITDIDANNKISKERLATSEEVAKLQETISGLPELLTIRKERKEIKAPLAPEKAKLHKRIGHLLLGRR